MLIIGLPVIVGSAYVMRWTAELDRRNAALVFGRPVRGAYRRSRGGSIIARVLGTLRDPQVWRDLAWLITHSVVGFAFGVLAVTLVATVAGLATLPLWYWSLPEGIEFGLWDADTLPWAIITAFLAVPLGVAHGVDPPRPGQVPRITGRRAARPPLSPPFIPILMVVSYHAYYH